jgi:DNA-directed RNA polymerase subunit RPC12/RpoP
MIGNEVMIMGRKLTDENRLSIVRPDIAAEWHPTKNGDLTPDMVSVGSDKVVWWLGACGHEWDMKIDKRIRRKQNCPYCSGKRICKDNCLSCTHPEIASEWNFDKNNGLTPDQVTYGSTRKVWWLGKCGHEWDDTIAHRTQGRNCPYCSGKRVNSENCLLNVNPSLAQEWHPTKNGKLDPSMVTCSSNKRVWWKGLCGHEWDDTINHRNSGRGCPFCAGKRVNITNCLATVNPELIRQWNFSKNKDISPYDITPGSDKIVWWICERGHEWKTQIKNRAIHGNECPYCVGNKLTYENSLQYTNPELSSEWHPTKNGNVTPSNVFAFSNKKYWWMCSEGHEWEANVSDRSRGRGCPICKESKGERFISSFLKKEFINFESQYVIEQCKNVKPLPFDFAIFDDKKLICLIEYQGEQHYKALDYFGGEEGFEQRKINDNIKRKYCIENNIPLIEIPYWEFDNLELFLTNELQKIGIFVSLTNTNKKVS